MTVTCINSNKIKVTLTPNERFRLFGETEYFSLENPSVKSAFRAILRKLKYQSPFLEDCSRVYIDLYKENSGGFVIYFTKLEKTLKNVFLFTDADNMLDALSSVKRLTDDYRVFSCFDKFYIEVGKSFSLDISPHIAEFCGIKTI